MTHKLYLTHKGRDKLTALATTGQGRPLTISHFAVGSGKNVDFSKRLSQTTLVQQRHKAPVASVVRQANGAYEIGCVIGDDVGGFDIAEIGLFADDGTLMWVGSLPHVQKPTAKDLSAVDYRLKCVVALDNADVTLTVTGNMAGADRAWVEQGFIPKSALELIFPIGYKYWTHEKGSPKAKFDALFGYETHWRRLDNVVLVASSSASAMTAYAVGHVAHDPQNANPLQGYVSHLWERYNPVTDIVRYDGAHRYDGQARYQ